MLSRRGRFSLSLSLSFYLVLLGSGANREPVLPCAARPSIARGDVTSPTRRFLHPSRGRSRAAAANVGKCNGEVLQVWTAIASGAWLR